MPSRECTLVTKMNNFWSDKKVLVTGCAGFKGSWLSLWLSQMGAHVIGISLKPESKTRLFDEIKLTRHINFTHADISSGNALENCFEQFEPEIVLHLAAQPLVIPSYEKPTETFRSNVMGTVLLLDLVRRYPCVKSTVIVSSDKCYKIKPDITYFDEQSELGGFDPYSASKACTEIVAQSFAQSYFNNGDTPRGLATARAGNVIGGGDWSPYRLMTDVINTAQKDKHIVLRHPDAVRPWQHVLEPLHGYLLLAQAIYESPQNFNGAWNFAPPESHCIAVKDVVAAALRNIAPATTIQCENSPYKETDVLTINASKARQQLKWDSVWHVDECIEKTSTWYQRYYAGESAFDLCLEQIQAFCEQLENRQ